MRQLFFSLIVVLTTIACQKQEVDCDNMKSRCTYIKWSYSDCTANGSEIGWKWDHIYSDTSFHLTRGCPEQLNADFNADQERTFNDPRTPIFVKKFMEQYPSSCNCE